MEKEYIPRKPIDILKIGYKYIIRNPKMIIPFMIYEAGFVVGQAIFIISFLSLLSYFKAFNLIPKIVEELSRKNYEYLLNSEILHPIIVTLFITASAYIIVILIFDSFVKAGLFPYLRKILIEGDSSLRVFLGYAFYRWKLVLKTNILAYSIIISPLLPSLMLFYFSTSKIIPTLGIENRIDELMLGISALAFIGGLALALILYLLLIFAPIAAAIDADTPILNVYKSIRIAKREVGSVILYFCVLSLIAIASVAIEGIVKIFYVTITSLFALIISLAITPIINMFLVAVYEHHFNESFAPVKAGIMELREIVKIAKIMAGINRYLRKFIMSKDGFLALVLTIILFTLGIILGLLTVSPDIRDIIINSGIIVPGRMNPEFKIYNRIFLGLDIFFHNWKTSLATAMAGIAYSIPSAVATLFNGYVIGIVYATVANPIKASAIIIPHGIIEIPAFLIASAAGLRLGYIMFKYIRGIISLNVLEEELTNTAVLVAALAVLFFIAGVIEGNITPIIAEHLGWV
ncbi:MAG: hypothetical protein B6U75_00590 [Desulfurococcales archaeon ex4484_217_1]|nr:MAG: hypothetical protein B6U75_00590 [Desulfurococcales archaeon ex4484_217_1]